MPDRLAAHPFFAGLAVEHLLPLVDLHSVECVQPGTKILRAGAPADAVRLIEEGRVALFLTEHPGATPFETLGPGDVLGLSWLERTGTWAFTAVAWADVTMLRLPATALRLAMAEDRTLHDHVTEQLNRALVERLHAVRLQHLDIYGGPDAGR